MHSWNLKSNGGDIPIKDHRNKFKLQLWQMLLKEVLNLGTLFHGSFMEDLSKASSELGVLLSSGQFSVFILTDLSAALDSDDHCFVETFSFLGSSGTI